jgi:hypothetical protein
MPPAAARQAASKSAVCVASSASGSSGRCRALGGPAPPAAHPADRPGTPHMTNRDQLQLERTPAGCDHHAASRQDPGPRRRGRRTAPAPPDPEARPRTGHTSQVAHPSGIWPTRAINVRHIHPPAPDFRPLVLMGRTVVQVDKAVEGHHRRRPGRRASCQNSGVRAAMLCRSRHASVRSLERYARPGPEPSPATSPPTGPAARRRPPAR